MKKLIAVAVVTLFTVAVNAADKLDVSTATEAQCRAALADILAQTNSAAMGDVFRALDFGVVARRVDLSAVRDAADEAFAARGFGLPLWPFVTRWPKASAVGRDINGASTNLAYGVSLAKRLGCDMSGAWDYYKAGASAGELVVVMRDFVLHRAYFSIASLGYYKRYIQQSAVKGIKRALRRQGKSFVVKDGVNPCEVYVTRLTTALDAPRFAGLNEWLADLGFEERIDLSGLPSEEEVGAIKDGILYGDIPLNDGYKLLLYVCLGVDGYNAFVKEYNGD